MNSQNKSLARAMVTDWHSLLLLLFSLGDVIWAVVYPFLDPNHFQIQNAIDAAVIAIVAFVFAHAHASLRSQQSVDYTDHGMKAVNPNDPYGR